MKRIITFWSITGVISAALFISVELAAMAAAAVWAISDLLALSAYATLALAAIVAVPSIYGMIRVWVLAFLTETDPENN